MAKKKDKGMSMPMDHDTEYHLDTLLRAHDIMKDADKMKKVHKLAGRRKKAIQSLDDVKAYAQSKYGPKKNDNDEDDME